MFKQRRLRDQFRRAQYRVDSEAVMEIAKTILSRHPRDVGCLRGVARLLTELRDNDSVDYWKRIADVDKTDIEAHCHLVRHEYQKGLDLSLAISKVAADLPEANRTIIYETIACPIVDPEPDPGSRVIAICGVSFCGSTLLDRILGSLPETRSIGESHRLAKTFFNGVAKPVDFTHKNSRVLKKCSVCGPDCEFLTRDFQSQLLADRKNWYFKIARRLKAPNLITADKNLPKLVEHDPLMRMDCLVLFKSPEQACYSYVEKQPKGRRSAFYKDALEQYITTWEESYSRFLDDVMPRGRTVFLNFDCFARNPVSVFDALIEKMELPQDESVLKRARPGHAIGGNTRTMNRIRQMDYAINITPLSAPDLPQKFLEMIASHEKMQTVYRRMMERCVSNLRS